MSAAPSNKGESGLSGRSVNEHNFVILLQVTTECRTNNILLVILDRPVILKGMYRTSERLTFKNTIQKLNRPTAVH